MNKIIEFKSVVAASLLKFDSLDNVDISLILEDLEKLSFYIRDIFILKELRDYAMIHKDGEITLKNNISLDSFVEDHRTTVRDKLEYMTIEELKDYFNKLDVEQFRKRKMDFLKVGKDKLLKNGNILLISDQEKEYDELIKYGFSHVDYFKSIIRIDRYFKKNPDESEKYHMIIIGNQPIIKSVFDEDQFLKNMRNRKDVLTISLNSWDYFGNLTVNTNLHDVRNNQIWTVEEDSYSKIFDKIMACAVLNKITEKIENRRFVPIQDKINPNRLALPTKKEGLKILYLDAISVNENAEEIAKKLGLDVTFMKDNNNSFEEDVRYVLGDYDIIIASDRYSSRLRLMSKESTEQCKDTGRELVLLLTYDEKNLSEYDCDCISHPFGYQISLGYSVGGRLSKSLDTYKKIYKAVDKSAKCDDRKTHYEHDRDICMKLILEGAVELYNRALEKNGQSLSDFNFKTFNQYELEYETALEEFIKQQEQELEPIRNFNQLSSALSSCLEYRNKRLVPNRIEGIKIEEQEKSVKVVNIIGGIEYCSMTIKKEDRYPHLKRFTIQTRSKKGILGDDEEVGIYTKKYEGMDGVPPRLNENQQGAFISICKKVKTVVNPLIADAILKEQEMEKTREEKPGQKNFIKRRRNPKDKKKK